MMSASRFDSDSAGLYKYSAELFDVRYAQKDYTSEAAVFSKLLDQIHPSAATLLDIACGTGRHLEHLRSRYQVEGLDLYPKILEIAKTRLIDVPLHQADMTNFDLGRSFDVVTSFFASITYVGSLDKLRDAISCMAKHLSPSGILFIEPWLTPAAYREDASGYHEYGERAGDRPQAGATRCSGVGGVQRGIPGVASQGDRAWQRHAAV